ncbi:DUF1289 domain-containing protein [Marinobacter psychrophilus]|uniref:DUF1289 domain-containing protein n=1 Tax=Marinobacter psychrophilus TaxID=330734 RepID=UPI000A06088F|nr:DUF1289 domain-containing protein [Marinobacter psychrophilus]
MAKEIESPCNSVCQLDGGVCRSCGRTRAEIKAWKGMKRPEKQTTTKTAALRLKKQRKVS